mmetsp:Transcript_8159/g.26760  ORF Transcript_8159/g.26760 Transcript_8159/m.26760 type:complete len:203 (+) Transcript_8159:499-1107(+)
MLGHRLLEALEALGGGLLLWRRLRFFFLVLGRAFLLPDFLEEVVFQEGQPAAHNCAAGELLRAPEDHVQREGAALREAADDDPALRDSHLLDRRQHRVHAEQRPPPVVLAVRSDGVVVPVEPARQNRLPLHRHRGVGRLRHRPLDVEARRREPRPQQLLHHSPALRLVPEAVEPHQPHLLHRKKKKASSQPTTFGRANAGTR